MIHLQVLKLVCPPIICEGGDWRMLQKRLGFRALMDVIPLDATLVKGSHGGCPIHQQDWPVLLTSTPDCLPGPAPDSTGVFQVLAKHLL